MGVKLWGYRRHPPSAQLLERSRASLSVSCLSGSPVWARRRQPATPCETAKQTGRQDRQTDRQAGLILFVGCLPIRRTLLRFFYLRSPAAVYRAGCVSGAWCRQSWLSSATAQRASTPFCGSGRCPWPTMEGPKRPSPLPCSFRVSCGCVCMCVCAVRDITHLGSTSSPVGHPGAQDTCVRGFPVWLAA